MLAGYRNEDGTQKETKPEAKVRMMLESEGLTYDQYARLSIGGVSREYDFRVYGRQPGSVFYLEVHGNYWHAWDYVSGQQPSRAALSKLQRRALRNDQLKREMCQKIGIELVTLWEHEVKSQPEICLGRIRQAASLASVSSSSAPVEDRLEDRGNAEHLRSLRSRRAPSRVRSPSDPEEQR